MYPSSEDIFSIAYSVLDTMVQCEASPALASRGAAAAARTAEDVTGCVQISGAWTGAVILQSTEPFARQAASHMLSIASDQVALADIQDAMAELTNMIGGNVKSQVPGPSYLSLPTVTTGDDFEFFLARSKTVSRVELTARDQPLRVLLCERSSEN